MILPEEIVLPKILNANKTTPMTHNFHPFSAKFIPQIPHIMIEKFTDEGDVVLDPFCGSGTTLVEAKLRNRNAIGTDIHPIGVLMSKVKITKLSNSEILLIKNAIYQIGGNIKETYNKKDFEIQMTFPNRDHWFERKVLKELEVIKETTQKIPNEKVRNFMLLGLSAIIVPVSNQESETRYAAITKAIPPLKTFALFETKVRDMLKRIEELNQKAADSDVKVYEADARKIDFIPNKSVDFIMTSPPYANTYDYYLYHKLRMYVLGCDVKRVRDNEIGSRNRYSSKKEDIDTYIEDMKICFEHFHRVLKADHFFVLVIGDAIIRKNFFDAATLTQELANRTGFEYVEKLSYSLNLISRTFNPSFRNKTKNEHIILLKKSGE